MAWIIVNQKAGSGRANRVGRDLSRMMRGIEVHPTHYPGHAAELAREAQSRGVERIVAVGGDGTFSEVASGLCLDGGGSPRPARTALALLPAGTGGDYRRSHGLSQSVADALRRATAPEPTPVDVGYAQCASEDGRKTSHIFINVMSFGLGGLTDRLVSAGPKWVGGRTAFLLGATRATLAYQPLPLQLVLDGQSLPTAAFTNVALCLGRYFGGGMHIAPDARLDDGLFDVVTMEGNRIQTLALSASIYRGTHLGRPGVRHFRASDVHARVTRDAECLVDLDGEQPGTLPITARVLPGALPLLV